MLQNLGLYYNKERNYAMKKPVLDEIKEEGQMKDA